MIKIRYVSIELLDWPFRYLRTIYYAGVIVSFQHWAVQYSNDTKAFGSIIQQEDIKYISRDYRRIQAKN